MTTFEVFSIILIALTLMATLRGWFVTAENQKKLLKLQQQGSERLARIPLRTARRADQFAKIAAWAVDTDKLTRLARALQHQPTKKEEAIAKFLEWENIYTSEILQTARFLDEGLVSALRNYYGYMNLYLMYSINGRIESLVNPVWNAGMAAAKEGFTAKMVELDKAIVDL